MRMPWLLALMCAGLLASSCSCAQSHAQNASVVDGRIRDGSGSDGEVQEDGTVPNECVRTEELGRRLVAFLAEDESCGIEQQRTCAAAMAALAEGAVAMCLPGRADCIPADHCFGGDPPGCACGDRVCLSDEVCVRPSMGAPARCERVCLHEFPVARECATDPPALAFAYVGSTTVCDELAERKCRLWAQAVAPFGHARASCLGGTAPVFCGMGDSCVAGDARERRRCDCGGAECARDEVCVSDVPEGVPRCVPACVPPV